MSHKQSDSGLESMISVLPALLAVILNLRNNNKDKKFMLEDNQSLSQVISVLPALAQILPELMAVLENKSDYPAKSGYFSKLQNRLAKLSKRTDKSETSVSTEELKAKLEQLLPGVLNVLTDISKTAYEADGEIHSEQ